MSKAIFRKTGCRDIRPILYYCFAFLGAMACGCGESGGKLPSGDVLSVQSVPDTLMVRIDASRVMDYGFPSLGLVHGTDPRLVSRRNEGGIRSIKIDQIFDILSEVAYVGEDSVVIDWGKFRSALADIEGAGAKPLIGVDFTSTLLSSRPHLENSARRSVSPTDYTLWEKLVTLAVEQANRESGRTGNAWEIWNEPDLGMFWDIPDKPLTRWATSARDPEIWTPSKIRSASVSDFKEIARIFEYRKLFVVTARAVRQADPDARAGGPAVSHYTPRWVKGLLNICSEQGIRLDYLSWHYPASVEELRRSVSQVRGWSLQRSGLQIPIYITEWVEWSTPSRGDMEASIDALSLLEAFTDVGVEQVYYYPTGTVLDTTKGLLPLMEAFRLFTHLSDPPMGVQNTPGISALASYTSEDRLQIVFWTALTGTRMIKFTIPESTPEVPRCVISLIEQSQGKAYNTRSEELSPDSFSQAANNERSFYTTTNGPSFGSVMLDFSNSER